MHKIRHNFVPEGMPLFELTTLIRESIERELVCHVQIVSRCFAQNGISPVRMLQFAKCPK